MAGRSFAHEAAAVVLRRVRDAREGMSRWSPGEHVGRDDLGLTALQLYPEGIRFHEVLAATADELLAGLDFDRAEGVGSIGSCFAEEMSAHFRKNGMPYRITEENTFGFSADWGRVYTIPSLRQIVQYSFDETFPVLVEEGERGWFDPLREVGVTLRATSRHDAEAAVRSHRAASRRAFEEIGVLGLTLGQNESWVDKTTGLHWASHPKRLGGPVDPARFEVVQPAFQECVGWLEEAIDVLVAANPRLRIVMTVSPVPAHAVFDDPAVITSSFANKCQLRAVAEVVRRSRADRVFYFPSFEAALTYNPRTYRPDNRHVKRAVIERIFGMLDGAMARSHRSASSRS